MVRLREKRWPPFKLWVGDGIADHLHFEGYLTHPQLTTLGVSTSLHEPFGLTIIEMMACGLPIIAVRSGGPADIVTPETGYPS